MQPHVNRQFDKELRELNDRLVQMGRLAEARIADAVRALVERDAALARRVMDTDQELDDLQLETDEQCLRLLALHQPAAVDLRFIVGAMKINSELERIGDQAVNTAQRAEELIPHPELKPLIDIPRMAQIARGMVHDSVEAFINRDADRAREVCRRDDELDDLKDQILRELVTYMAEDPHVISRALNLILVSRHLERIGDLATNISEDVVLIVRGSDIRHHATGDADQQGSHQVSDNPRS